MNRVVVYNPLPNALRHYTKELQNSLGMPDRSFNVVNVRTERLSVPGKAYSLYRHLKAIRSVAKTDALIVVAWPLLGWLDKVLWSTSRASRRGHVWIIVHDPVPLRRQLGMGKAAALLASRFQGARFICHSAPAAEALAKTHASTEKPVVLPHPILGDERGPRMWRSSGESQTLLVLGQFKPARDLDLLRDLGPRLRKSGFRGVIAGSGWPQIPHWYVQSGFLSEEEFDRRLRDADVLLVPYRRYFQSGVAVRALEVGTPVVGARTGFLEEMLGKDYEGFVSNPDDPDDWLSACARVRARDVPLEIDGLEQRVGSAWRVWVRQQAL